MDEVSQPQPGSEKRYHLRVIRHAGLLLAWHQLTRQFTGTYEQCMSEYGKAQRHNLLFGWWSIGSIILMNWLALVSNMRAAKKLKEIAGRT